MKKIAIQGVKGSYHDMAAHQYFEEEELELICCSTFEDVFKAMNDDNNVIGVMAIENTIAGSLLHNYDLLRENRMTIVGEHKLRISHSLLCLPEDGWGRHHGNQFTPRGTGTMPRIPPTPPERESGRS